MKNAILFVVPLVFWATALAQKTLPLSYEPTVVTIGGAVEVDTFAGRPNFDNIRRGDEPEICWVLKLPKPISVLVSENDEVNESEDNVAELQLTMRNDQFEEYRKFLGRKVKVTGTLFHAVSPHHHTIVLLQVKRIVPG